MSPEDRQVETTGERTLTPERLAVLNIEALMKARGVTRSELAKRLDDLGFRAWRHEKTIRNLFDGQRGLKVDELFGIAAALNSTIMDLTSPRTRREVFPDDQELGPRVSLGNVIRGEIDYLSLWFGLGAIKVPTHHLNWVVWRPGEIPVWANSLLQEVQAIVDMHVKLGLGDPPAPVEDLTADQLQEMMSRITPVMEAKISATKIDPSLPEQGTTE